MITLSHFDAGTYTVKEDSYTTRAREACAYEIHEEYVDVHYVLNGEEYMDIVSPEGLTFREPFDKQTDIGFFNELVEPSIRVHLRPNMYCVIFPWEAHMPCIAVNDTPLAIEKRIAKIPLADFMRMFEASHLQAGV